MSVLFIHGWATNKAIWPQSFTGEKKHIYDCANYPDYQHLTKTFLEICKQEEEKITLVGWSLGGMLALQLAAEYTAKIARLILLSTTPRFTLCQSYEGGLPGSVVKNLSRKLARNSWETQMEFYHLMFSPMEKEWHQKFITYIAPHFSNINVSSLQAGLTYLMEQDLRQELAKVNLPCLIIHGMEDKICPPSAAQYLLQHLPQGELRLLHGTGHVPFITQEKYVKDLVMEGVS
ncbi:alpha/beta fold hydrolase [Pelosinus fermentans]|uniref:AB hydrolase-1 domain-containing protein n=1 Tax=Pelosinus fermentans JBW45 TaxID=1192197 RepID=I8TYX2_9FIRM|nr:alpha/beta fold hydrolase [Pelosinus fermentans]AJQ28412.1 hypothetical protein JBW_03071 [Pelosinus fermentans JBW45]